MSIENGYSPYVIMVSNNNNCYELRSKTQTQGIEWPVVNENDMVNIVVSNVLLVQLLSQQKQQDVGMDFCAQPKNYINTDQFNFAIGCNDFSSQTVKVSASPFKIGVQKSVTPSTNPNYQINDIPITNLILPYSIPPVNQPCTTFIQPNKDPISQKNLHNEMISCSFKIASQLSSDTRKNQTYAVKKKTSNCVPALVSATSPPQKNLTNIKKTNRLVQKQLISPRAQWFNIKRINKIEKFSFPDWFNGRSKYKTPKAYKYCRDWIVTQFHSNSSVYLTGTKCRQSLFFVDAASIIRLHHFLQYWGIINTGVTNSKK